MRKTALCLGGGIESVPIIQRARELGLRTIVVDANPEAPGFAYADSRAIASCYHYESAVPAIKERPDAVLCCAVDSPIVAARLAERYHLVGLPVEAAILSEDKFEQKKRLMMAGVRVPKFGMVHERKDALTVVKPRDGRGGRGVIRILPGVDFDWAYKTASKGGKNSLDVMTEEWLEGPQYSTESIVQGGHVLWTSVALRNYARLDEFAPYVIEDGSDSPAELPGINALIEKACHVLGWDNLTVKGDIVLHDNNLYVIELAARLSGGYFASHITPLAYGVDFVDHAIEIAFGETVRVEPVRTRHVCQRFVFPAPEDVGKRVAWVAPYTHADYATWNIRTYDTIGAVDCHPNRWGQIIESGKTAEFARARAETGAWLMKAGVVLE